MTDAGQSPAFGLPQYGREIRSARVAILVDSTRAGGLHVTVEINESRVEFDADLLELERILSELVLAL